MSGAVFRPLNAQGKTMRHDPEFTGDKLTRLVVDIEAAVGMNMAGTTPLGAAVIRLCEDTADASDKQQGGDA